MSLSDMELKTDIQNRPLPSIPTQKNSVQKERKSDVQAKQRTYKSDWWISHRLQNFLLYRERRCICITTILIILPTITIFAGFSINSQKNAANSETEIGHTTEGATVVTKFATVFTEPSTAEDSVKGCELEIKSYGYGDRGFRIYPSYIKVNGRKYLPEDMKLISCLQCDYIRGIAIVMITIYPNHACSVNITKSRVFDMWISHVYASEFKKYLMEIPNGTLIAGTCIDECTVHSNIIQHELQKFGIFLKTTKEWERGAQVFVGVKGKPWLAKYKQLKLEKGPLLLKEYFPNLTNEAKG